MNLADAFLFPHERAMLVGPLENRALEVAHVGEPGGTQPVRHFSRAITDRAIGHDRRFFWQSSSGRFG